MDQKDTEKLSKEPPVYSFGYKMTDARKNWKLLAVILLLLTIIIISAIIIGVYMTQKHTEKMLTMAFTSDDGQKIQQTVIVNQQENVAAFYVKSDNSSFTVLYDYKRAIIGFRETKRENCYVIKMDKNKTPSLTAVIDGLQYFQMHNSPAEHNVSYSITGSEKANPLELGTSINILCSDVPIYWAKLESEGEHHRKLTLKFKVFGIPVKVEIGR